MGRRSAAARQTAAAGCYRPLTWPVWDHEHRRLVRFWSASDDLDLPVVEALRSRRLDRVTVVDPSVDELAVQLREELAVSRRHLVAMRDSYWDPDWRRHHTGHDESTEDHLWRAATAVTDIWAALDGLQG